MPTVRIVPIDELEAILTTLKGIVLFREDGDDLTIKETIRSFPSSSMHMVPRDSEEELE